MRVRNDRGPSKQNIRFSLAGKVSYCVGMQGKLFVHVTTLMTYVSLYKVYEHLHISVSIGCLIVFYSMSHSSNMLFIWRGRPLLVSTASIGLCLALITLEQERSSSHRDSDFAVCEGWLFIMYCTMFKPIYWTKKHCEHELYDSNEQQCSKQYIQYQGTGTKTWTFKFFYHFLLYMTLRI